MSGIPAPAERLALLSEEARKHAGKTRPPVDAATLILIDRKGREPRMLMGRRHANHRFMPDVFVFPGGRSEAGDSRVPQAGPLARETLDALMLACPRGNPTRMRRLALAAIRETFEETGLVIGQKAPPPQTSRAPGPNSPRPAICPIFPRSPISPARSRRRDARNGSIRDFSWRIRARSLMR